MSDAPPFEAPWHAQAFALTHHLADRGTIRWSNWTGALSQQVAARRIETSDDYYRAWIAALESLLPDTRDLDALTEAWRGAYLETPHGQPVALGGLAESDREG